jgi:hypothetical protein
VRCRFGADASGVLAKRDAGLRQRGTACGPREKLDTEFGFQPEQPSTDDRLRNTETPGSRRYPASIGYIDKSPKIFEIHHQRSTYSDTDSQIMGLLHRFLRR